MAFVVDAYARRAVPNLSPGEGDSQYLSDCNHIRIVDLVAVCDEDPMPQMAVTIGGLRDPEQGVTADDLVWPESCLGSTQ